MKVYYAHPMSWYDTFAETEDVVALEEAGHEVLNPNQQRYSDEVQRLRSKGLGHMVMEPFMRAVKECEAVAYRPFKDGRVGAGVAKEVLEAVALGYPVICLPFTQPDEGGISHLFELEDVLTIEETRERIRAGAL